MTNRIVVLHEDDLKELLERNSREAAAAVLQGLALSLSGGAAAALAAATSRKLTTATQAFNKEGQQQLLALPGVEPTQGKKGRPKGAKTGTGPRSGKAANYNKEKRTILPMDAPGDWMTPSAASKFLGISDAAVYFAINRGTLHAKHSEAGSLLVERGQVAALKKERAGVYKKRQEASGKGVPRGGKGKRAMKAKAKTTPDSDAPPVNLSAGWLSGDDAMSTLGLTYAQLKRYRKAGQVKVRPRPGPHTGTLPPFEFETASVLALRAKLAK